MPGGRKNKKSKRKRSRNLSNSNPAIGTPRAKGPRVDNDDDTPRDDEEDSDSDDSLYMDLEEEIEAAEEAVLVEAAVAAANDIDKDVISGPDINVIMETLAENSTRMGDAPPWACGLSSVIEQLCLKVKSLESENTALKKSLQFSQAGIKLQDT